jgi:hypothetical protein
VSDLNVGGSPYSQSVNVYATPSTIIFEIPPHLIKQLDEDIYTVSRETSERLHSELTRVLFF